MTYNKLSLTERSKQIHKLALWYFKWATTCQNQQSDCAPSEDSDQPGHLPSPSWSESSQDALSFCWFCHVLAQSHFMHGTVSFFIPKLVSWVGYAFFQFTAPNEWKKQHSDISWTHNSKSEYRNVAKFSDRHVWANSADPDRTAPGLHCLQFPLHHLDALLWGKAILLNF